MKAEEYFRPYISQEKYYEKAEKTSIGASVGGSLKPFSTKISAGILPHHLVFPQYISEFFSRLALTQDVDTFVVIGPNHFMNGSPQVCVSEYGFSTPYGELEPNFELVNFLTEKGYASWDEKCFANEHSINSLTSFIKKSFPNAKIVAIVTKYTTKKDDLDDLVSALNTKLNSGDFVLGSIDFSHYLPEPVADFHDEMSATVIKNMDMKALWDLEIDSRPSLYSVLSYASQVGAKNVEILHHTNSAGKVNGRDFMPETTSHFYATFDDESPESTEDAESTESGRDITITAVGDIMLGRYVRTLMDREKNLYYPFARILGTENRFFMGSDLFFGNLEGPISGSGFSSGTSLIFGFNEDTAPLLRDVGFDVLSLANNHTLNQRANGLTATYENLNKNEVSPCGNPAKADSVNTFEKDIDGVKVAFACFNDIEFSLNENDAASIVSDLKTKNDYVIVSIHWGNEYQHTPNQRQTSLAHKFVDAGADFIIGHHPHVVQPFEIYNGKFIFYSLGNFIFDQYWSFDTQEELAIGIVLGANKTKVYLFPMLSEKSQPYLMNYEEKKKFYDRFIKWGGFDENYTNQIRNSLVEI